MAPKVRFIDGEKVLCFHGPLLYEAKCIKSQVKEKNVKYFIHYSGWNKNWDEWVPESRVLKYNDTNMQKQKELEATHGKSRKTKTVKSSSKKDAADREASALPPQEKTTKQKVTVPTPPAAESQADLQRKKRTRTEQHVETEEEYLQKMEIKIKIPDELKHWLVDDWDLITRQKKVVQLPARATVETILSDYLKQKLSVKGMTPNKESALTEVTNGIREYFNVMLGRQLLYNFEKLQYSELTSENPDLSPSQMYGAVHLLRFFSKLGGALAYTALNEDTINLLSTHLYDFLRYLSKSSVTLFSMSDYISPSPDYVKKTS